MFILIPYCYIPGAFIVFLVKERTCKSKHLQLVSGVSMGSYWIAHYIWDVTLFAILTACVMIIFLIYSVDDAAAVFVGDVESFFCTMVLTFGYGLSVLPFSYLLARGHRYVWEKFIGFCVYKAFCISLHCVLSYPTVTIALHRLL
jgi:ATP-binding cassette subfamily A (ABC1) protein 3